MLYCPKCQAMYEDGSQRFCTNEGARLLPYTTSEKSDQSSKGVFTSILNKSSIKKENSAKVSESAKSGNAFSAFQPPKSRFFKSDENESAEKEETVEENPPTVSKSNEPEKEETETLKPIEPLPLAGIINPSKIPEKQVESDKIFSKTSSKTAETESDDALELSLDEPAKNDEILDFQDDIDLSVEDRDLDSEIALDLGIGDFSETESQEVSQNSAEISEISEDNNEIELDLFDIDEQVADSPENQKIELELDEIEDVSVPEPPRSNGLELDLQSKEEVDLKDSIPRIELDLIDLDDVSIPSESEPESNIAEEPETLELSEPLEIEDEQETESAETEEPFTAPIFSTEPEVAKETPEIAETVEVKEEEKPKTAVVSAESVAAQAETADIKTVEESSTQISSTDSLDKEESRWFLYPLIGIIVLGFILLGYFYLTQNNSQNETPANSSQANQANAIENANVSENINTAPINSDANASNSQDSSSFQSYPGGQSNPKIGSGNLLPPRQIKQPPNTVLYRNERKNQRGELSENFLGFSIYYPKDWKESRADNKFLDISKKTPQGLPIKQLLISRYDSKGTFEADRAIFDDLVKTSNDDLRKILSNYQVISKGEATFQNGRWQVYEVDFQGIGSDKKLIIWGKRLWIPVQREGMKSGFIITMIGTSLSDDVKSVNDLGENDDLAEILKTFEPELN